MRKKNPIQQALYRCFWEYTKLSSCWLRMRFLRRAADEAKVYVIEMGMWREYFSCRVIYPWAGGYMTVTKKRKGSFQRVLSFQQMTLHAREPISHLWCTYKLSSWPVLSQSSLVFPIHPDINLTLTLPFISPFRGECNTWGSHQGIRNGRRMSKLSYFKWQLPTHEIPQF